MELIDFIAILGALAWTPPLFQIIKKRMTKPEVTIITSNFAEIGFTNLGNIFNLRVAFAVKHHDIVISDFKIRLKHESGEIRLFNWQGMRQELSTVTTPDGSIMPNEKAHSVLAIKLNQQNIEERSIQCQEIGFNSERKEAESKAVKKMNYLKELEKFKHEDFLKTQEMSELYSFIKQSFSWKAGQYDVEITVNAPEPFEIKNNKFKFSLSNLDIEYLEKNKNEIEKSFEVLKDDKSNKVIWNWRNPQIIN